MCRYLSSVMLAATLFVLGVVSPVAAQKAAPRSEKQQLKTRQRAARKIFKAQTSNTNKRLKDTRIPRSQRVQVKHQMQREKHELRARQKEERQDLRDRQRIRKERSSRS